VSCAEDLIAVRTLKDGNVVECILVRMDRKTWQEFLGNVSVQNGGVVLYFTFKGTGGLGFCSFLFELSIVK